MSCCGSGMGHIDVKVIKKSYYDIYKGHNKQFFSYMS